MERREIESRILGAVMRENHLLNNLGLKPHYFEFLGKEFDAMAQLSLQNLKFDCVGVGDVTGDLATAHKIHESACAASNAKHYTEQLAAMANKARALNVISEGWRNVDELGCDAIDALVSELTGLLVDDAKSHEITMKQSLIGVADRLEDAFMRVSHDGVGVGIASLENALGRFHNSDLIVVGGRPASGKTLSLLNFAEAGTESGCVGFFTTEQSAEQISMRYVSKTARISSHKIRTQQIEEPDLQKAFSAMTILAQKDLIYYDKSRLSVQECARVARKWKAQHDVKAIYVDYIQRMFSETAGREERDQITEVVKGLKSIAKDLNIPVVALAQVNRKCEDRSNKRPMVSDLHGAGSIEMEADQIILIYRDEVYNQDTDRKGVIEFDVGKNRHGGTGVVEAFCELQYFNITDLGGDHDWRR